jgi:Flp pilus assembly pilin Flp
MDLQPSLCERFRMLCGDRGAVTMIEYAIMGSLIAAVLVVAIPPVTSAVKTEFQFMADQIPAR